MGKLILLDRSDNLLAVALEEFQQNLSADQQEHFNSIASGTPTAEDIILLTQEIDEKNAERKSRVIANRMRGVLESVQQYCAVVDTFVQSNPTIAALVWGTVKFVILVVALASLR
jgi:nitrate/nitrite-specific signal transduction histidine kinase